MKKKIFIHRKETFKSTTGYLSAKIKSKKKKHFIFSKSCKFYKIVNVKCIQLIALSYILMNTIPLSVRIQIISLIFFLVYGSHHELGNKLHESIFIAGKFVKGI